MTNIVDIEERLVKKASDLRVFQKAYALSLEIHKASLAFPKAERYALSSQMRRASKSICANLTEGFARQPDSKAEFNRYISIAIGSAAEMELWVKYAHDLGYITLEDHTDWQDQYDHIQRMLRKLRIRE